MKIWKRFGSKEFCVMGLAVVIGIGIVVGTVYAANPNYAYRVSTSKVVLWGFGNDNIVIDPFGAGRILSRRELSKVIPGIDAG